MTPRRFANAMLVGLFLAGITAYGGASLWNLVADRTTLRQFAWLTWKYFPIWAEANFTSHLAARTERHRLARPG